MPTAPRTTAQAPLDWDALQGFLAVCRAGSVSRAAAQIGVRHTTVLRRVAALERALGTPLFDRASGSYALSAAGAELLSRLSGVANRIAASAERAQGLDEALDGEVRLTTTDTLARGLLMPLLESFGARHPRVRLRVIVDNHFLSLTRREADVAIRGSTRPPLNLVGRRVGAIQTAPYACRAQARTALRLRDVNRLDWVAPDEALAHLEQAKWLAKHVDAGRIVMRVDSLVGMVQAVRSGIGAALLLCPLADAHADLVRLAPPDPALDTPLWILTHPDLRQVARVRAFTQHMVDALAADPRLVH